MVTPGTKNLHPLAASRTASAVSIARDPSATGAATTAPTTATASDVVAAQNAQDAQPAAAPANGY